MERYRECSASQNILPEEAGAGYQVFALFD